MYEKVLEAAKRLEGVAHKTPVLTSTLLNEKTGNQIYLKCENFQRGGAFKFRGAYNAISSLNPEVRKKGIIAFSSGNHAMATALTCEIFGVPAMIVVPDDVAKVKMDTIKYYGATVVTFDRAKETREVALKRQIDKYGYTFIPPFDHENVVAGQGTIAKELIEEVGELDYVFAPCSGGGLLSGTVVSAKHLLPECKVIGVQPEQADYTVRAFKTGIIQRMDNVQTVADGLRGACVGNFTFEIIKKMVDDLLTVSESEIIDTMYYLWTRLKIIVEPAGGVGLAPLLHDKLDIKGKRIGIIVSGGNVDVRKCGELFANVCS